MKEFLHVLRILEGMAPEDVQQVEVPALYVRRAIKVLDGRQFKIMVLPKSVVIGRVL
jgi:hypothetical protein